MEEQLATILATSASTLVASAAVATALEKWNGWAPWTRQVAQLRAEVAQAREDDRKAQAAALEEQTGSIRRAVFGEPPHSPGLVAVLRQIQEDVHLIRDAGVEQARANTQALRDLRDAVMGERARGGG